MKTDKPLCTAADLNGRYLGRWAKITDTLRGGHTTSIQGVLSGVEHGANLISEKAVTQAEESWTLGRGWVQITLLNYGGARVSPGATVELLD